MEQTPEKTNRIMRAIADLFPGYFALVMATAITSIAANLIGYTSIAWALFYINIAAFAILSLMLVVRLVWFPRRVLADLTDHVRGPGFFTVTAGTCVFGSQCLLVAGDFDIAGVLWIIGFGLWVIIMYAFFAAITTLEHKPDVDRGLNGAWHLTAVSAQSVSVLGTLLADHFVPYRETLLFVTLCMFFIGCMLYLILITLIFYRFTFVDLTSERLTPPYWINMGAVAITTLAGARLLIAAPESALLREIVPFLRGFTLFFWSAGTWWIPLLFVLGFWRHVYKRYPLRYDPQYWGLVFPLGMYTTCTFQLSKALDFEPLMVIPTYFIYIAMAAWLAAFVGLIHTLVKRPAVANG